MYRDFMKMKTILAILLTLIASPLLALDLSPYFQVANGEYLHTERERFFEDLFLEWGSTRESSLLYRWDDRNGKSDANGSYLFGIRASEKLGPGNLQIHYSYNHSQAGGRASFLKPDSYIEGSFKMSNAFAAENVLDGGYLYPIDSLNLEVGGGLSLTYVHFQYDARYHYFRYTNDFMEKVWSKSELDYGGAGIYLKTVYSPFQEIHLDLEVRYSPGLYGTGRSSALGTGVIHEYRQYEVENEKTHYWRSSTEGSLAIRYEPSESGFFGSMGGRYRSISDAKQNFSYTPMRMDDGVLLSLEYYNTLYPRMDGIEWYLDREIQGAVRKKSETDFFLQGGWKFKNITIL